MSPLRYSRWWLPMLLLMIVLAACAGGPNSGSDSPAKTPAVSDDGAAPSVGNPGDASLCDAFTEALAVAALGGPVAEPQSGEVVPRPNGIYCRYTSVADAGVNVEAQLKEQTRAEFDELVGFLNMTEPLDGVGEAAFQLERSTLGGAGASVAAFNAGRGVVVIINGEGDTAAQLAAAVSVAEAALASGT